MQVLSNYRRMTRVIHEFHVEPPFLSHHVNKHLLIDDLINIGGGKQMTIVFLDENVLSNELKRLDYVIGECVCLYSYHDIKHDK